jgi:hypothetical protein
MSHIVEEYAKSCGVYVGEPIIQEHYYPIVFDKYITIHSDAKDQARDYMHWDIVLRLIKKPLSDHGIKIIQIGAEGARKLPFIDKITTGASLKNSFYIIKNSLLHVGINSCPSHVASAYNKKIVSLYSNLFPECCYPYWSNKKDIIDLSPDFSKIKPSFSKTEKEPRIDEIKPEKIAESVLKMLDIKHKVNFKCEFFGPHYNKKGLDVVPNNSKIISNKKINIRMDKHFDLKQMSQLINLNESEVTTNKVIPVELLDKVKKINYISEKFDDNFVNKLKDKNIKVDLYCSNNKNLNDERARLFDEKILNYSKKSIKKSKRKKLDKINIKKSKFLSYRTILYKDKIYLSYYEISGDKSDLILDLNHILIYSNPYDEENRKKNLAKK